MTRYYKILDETGAVLYVGTGELGGEEIDKAEYDTLKAEILSRPPEPDRPDAEATEADYQAALAQMGVDLSDEGQA